MRLCLAFLVAVLCAVGPASAAERPLPAGPIEAEIRALAPGDFLWAAEASPRGPVSILISLPLQRAYVYRNGVLIGVSTVSTGREGYETPAGVFTILQKRREHYSNLYDNAPMPFMQRLTWGGIALHAGNLPGHPASHGCIRLPHEFARRLFQITDLGITVIVSESASVPRLVAENREDFTTLSVAGPATADFVWRPWLQEDGPISILVSAADREVHVIRNGVEIGKAMVELSRPVSETEIYQLFAADPPLDEFIWISVPMKEGVRSAVIGPEDRAQLSLPEDFRSALAAELVPGTTVVVTPDTLESVAFDQTVEILAVEE